MPDPKELQSSTATGAKQIKIHEELGTPTRGPSKKKRKVNIGPRKHEQIFIDEEQYSTNEHFARRHGLTTRYIARLQNDPAFPLPFVIVAGKRYIREKSASVYFKAKERRETESNRITWRKKIELLNQNKVQAIKDEIEADRARPKDALDD